MSELTIVQIFQNSKFGKVRIIEVNGETYFVANDVAKALRYTNPSKATNDHCKKSFKTWGSDSLGRRQEFKVIPEGDIYRLVIKSQLPGADEFESWIFDEVLPSIRKNGSYAKPPSKEQLYLQTFQMLTEDVKVLEAKNQELEYVVEVQEKKLENKSVYEDIGRRFIKTDETRAIQFVAKKHNMTSNELNKFLESKGIQRRSKEGTWILNSPYDKKGYAKLVELPCKNNYIATTLEWTRSGESFISNELEQFEKDSFKTQLIPISNNSSFIH